MYFFSIITYEKAVNQQKEKFLTSLPKPFSNNSFTIDLLDNTKTQTNKIVKSKTQITNPLTNQQNKNIITIQKEKKALQRSTTPSLLLKVNLKDEKENNQIIEIK